MEANASFAGEATTCAVWIYLQTRACGGGHAQLQRQTRFAEPPDDECMQGCGAEAVGSACEQAVRVAVRHKFHVAVADV